MLEWKARWKMGLVVFVVLGLCACGSSEEPTGARGAPAPEAAAASSTAVNESEGGFGLGEPRGDIDRFFGVYGDPEYPTELRGQFFVVEAKRPRGAEQAPEIPPGFLAIGAMWGDVAPMSMKSLSEAKFEQVDLSDFAPAQPTVVEFAFGPDGKAVALTFTSGFEEFQHRVRLGDIPDSWQ